MGLLSPPYTSCHTHTLLPLIPLFLHVSTGEYQYNPGPSYSYPISTYYSLPYSVQSDTFPQPKKKPHPLFNPKAQRKQEEREKSNSQLSLPRVPGLPNDIPLPTVNITNVITVLELAEDPDQVLTDEQQALILQVLSQIINLIGFQDLRDWIGIISMLFIMAPVIMPLYFMPIALIMLGAFMIPLVVNGASVAAAGAAGRGSSFSPGDESYCWEMVSCEVKNLLRTSDWSSWISRTFQLTAVEWAGLSGRGGLAFLEEEECGKYFCNIVQPAQSFFSKWYSHLFTYQKHKPDMSS